jgi:hypothetical protein
MVNVDILHGHFVFFTATWYMLWPYGIFYGHLVIFPCFGILYQGKSGNPAQKQSVEICLQHCQMFFVI